jgi:hypothetical protein
VPLKNAQSERRDDLVSRFGGREGPHGHTEPMLDDGWDAVDRAAPKLDEVFASFLTS